MRGVEKSEGDIRSEAYFWKEIAKVCQYIEVGKDHFDEKNKKNKSFSRNYWKKLEFLRESYLLFNCQRNVQFLVIQEKIVLEFQKVYKIRDNSHLQSDKQELDWRSICSQGSNLD